MYAPAVAYGLGSAERAVESLNSPPVIGRLMTGLRLLKLRAQWAAEEGLYREVALGPKEDLVEVQKLWIRLGWD